MAVIGADAGGPAELITHEVDGLLFKPGSVPELAAALRRLREDPELRLRLVAAARVRAVELAPEVIAEQVTEIYRTTLRAHGL